MSHERPSSQSPDEQRDDNPFAPPPEGRPDRPWEPRERPEGREGQPGQGDHGQGDDGAGPGSGSQDGGQPPVWGSQWSSRQPGRHDGGFGGGPGGPRPPGGGGRGGGPGGSPGGGSGLRWDPTDPAQRRARYALLAGMWGFFFALFSIPQVALLLGALSLYWGISSLRAKSAGRRPDPDGAGVAPGTSGVPGTSGTPGVPGAPGVPGVPGAFRPQTTAAVSGLVTGGLALAIVAATFLFQIVYSDYYTCVDDALTQTSRQACENHLPKELRPLLGTRD
ncbi:hypothetical protein [Streptomyces albireticuli]|uniref:hypothetical protein n=1 Tax=Streptomyces albireticuli TaxID=1940 RepID=UPI001E46888F|nr:hypothetical protein [Streptomyces albireticuli]MCD9142845.1 hypothetical protein [Streptomyces albireticuli]MCD9162836.1 hypothetical protein [Streptomyces albireticuli]MCD9192396.1 hypothetical protein [Streptomyces albireticuli]